MDKERLYIAAQRLLDDEAFKVVMDELKRETFENWTRTSPEQEDLRDDMYYFYVAIEHIENRLTALSNNLKIDAAKAAKPIREDEQ